jgi:hypothetical protein
MQHKIVRKQQHKKKKGKKHTQHLQTNKNKHLIFLER